jgi:hypothetical protein
MQRSGCIITYPELTYDSMIFALKKPLLPGKIFLLSSPPRFLRDSLPSRSIFSGDLRVYSLLPWPFCGRAGKRPPVVVCAFSFPDSWCCAPVSCLTGVPPILVLYVPFWRGVAVTLLESTLAKVYQKEEL